MTGRAVVAALVVALLVAPPAGAMHPSAQDGSEILDRAVAASRSTAYAGEVLWVVFEPERPHVTAVYVAGNADGGVAVQASEQLGDDGILEEWAMGWALPLPVAVGAGARLGLLDRNYEIVLEGRQPVLARTATVLAFRRRDSGVVRERLWVDEERDLPLRRETYGRDGELRRLGTFLALDLDPRRADLPSGGGLEDRLDGVTPVDEEDLETLRKAGWTVPETLPGGYEAVAAYAVDADGAQPLQVVYADGLYTVSVFQQEGTPDQASLPAGAQLIERLPGEVYGWPGALPQRYMWTGGGRTWSLVGDAPPDDLHDIAGALPGAEPIGIIERLRRGFSRLWSGMSEWGAGLWR